MPITDNINVTAVVPYAGECTRSPSLGSKTAKLPSGQSIGFGLAIVAGASAGVGQLPTATGQRFLGVTERVEAIENPEAGTPPLYTAGSYPDVSYTDWIEGIAVETNTLMAVGDPVFFVHSGADAGKFRNDDTTADVIASAVCTRSFSATRAEIQLRVAP